MSNVWMLRKTVGRLCQIRYVALWIARNVQIGGIFGFSDVCHGGFGGPQKGGWEIHTDSYVDST